MRSLPFFAFGLMGLVCLIMFGRLPGSSPGYYYSAPDAECSIINDEFVVLEFEGDARKQRIGFNENGYYFRDRSKKIAFKHWHDDRLYYHWRSPFDRDRHVVSDHRSFQLAVDENCYAVLREHPVMKWVSLN